MGNGEAESTISTKGDLDLQDPGLVPDLSETTNDHGLVERRNEISGNLQSGDPAIPNVGGGIRNTPRYGNADFSDA